MGESRRKALAAREGSDDTGQTPQVVHTRGERMHVRWDEHAAATSNGQLVFFAEFLATPGQADGRIAEHHDYWNAAVDLYEKLPLIGALMRWLKRRAAA